LGLDHGQQNPAVKNFYDENIRISLDFFGGCLMGSTKNRQPVMALLGLEKPLVTSSH
jgi:hypothetical protein